jgi:hypothetical protein
MRFAVEALAEESPTEPPVVLLPPPRDERLSPGDAPAGAPIRPVGYTPRRRAPSAASRRAVGGRTIALGGLLLVALAVAGLVSQLAAVGVAIEPEPDTVALRGGWPVVRLGARFVAWPGRYSLVAEKAGYRRRGARRGDGRGGAGGAPGDAAPAGPPHRGDRWRDRRRGLGRRPARGRDAARGVRGRGGGARSPGPGRRIRGVPDTGAIEGRGKEQRLP